MNKVKFFFHKNKVVKNPFLVIQTIIFWENFIIKIKYRYWFSNSNL